MNILVTGCMGFIGSNLVSKLLNQGHHVIGFDNLSKPSIAPTDRIKKESKENWKNFRFYNCDILDMHNMKSILAANNRLNVVIHLAAMGSVPLSYIHPSKCVDNNIVGFTNVLELSKIFEVKNFVFASSSAVYGKSQIELRSEGSLTLPKSPYGLSKKVNEEMAVMLTPPTMSFVGLRFFNVYGPGQSMNGYYTPVIPNFITKEKPEVYGNGEVIRDFTYVDDVCDAIIKSMYCTSNAIVNVGTGIQTSLNQLLIYLNKKEQAIYTDQRHGDVLKSYADTKYAKNVLNFEAKMSIVDGLKITKAFYDEYVLE